MGLAKPNQPALEIEIAEFLVDREARNLSPNTMNWYRSSLTHWSTFLTQNHISTHRHVTPGVIRRFLVQLQQEGHNEGGVYNIFGAVRALLHWYVVESAPPGWENPLDKVETPKRSEEIEQPISLANFQKLVDTCTDKGFEDLRDKAIFLTLLDSGVRRQELTDLTIGDYNRATGAILVKRGKGRKTRSTFIGHRTRRAINSYLVHRPKAKDDDPLWVTQKGDKMKAEGIRQMMRRRAAQAGVKEPGFHEFRRAFAVNFLRNGGDVITLQRLLGHTSLVIINRYLALVDDDLRASHAKHGVVDNMK